MMGRTMKRIIGLMNALFYHMRWAIRNFSRTSLSDNKTCLVGKTAIVTGGNSGIGYATSVLLASRGCRVIIACRSDAKDAQKSIIDLTGNPNIIVKYLDLSKLKTVRSFAEDIKKNESKIDILVNNAGIGASTEACSEDGLNYVMQVNFFGHFLLTHLLVDRLRAAGSANVIFLSSGIVSIHNLKLRNLNPTRFKLKFSTSGLFYSNSKVCSILAAQEFAEKLRKYGITVNSADPGIVRTPLIESTYEASSGFQWMVKCMMEPLIFFYSTDEYMAAQTTFHLASSKNLETGAHYFRCKPFVKPKILNDKEFCRKIWLKSEELVALSTEEKLT